MRKLVLILLLLCFVGLAFAQQPSADFTTITVDGQVTSSKLEDMDANNIFKVEKVISPMEVGSTRKNIIVKVITKPHAIYEYQGKLSAFSKEYRAYLDGSNRKDDELMYILNGILLQQRDSITKKLYDIPPKQLKEVVYLPNPSMFSKVYTPFNKCVVIITTKK
nr:hypothetical protein [uncultured Mucilaginibacter sp.]